MGGDEIEIPIYLITGFLESGKTTFINFTVAQDYFQIDEPTLLITTEEGEVEYDEKELLKYNTVLEVVESQEQFTPEYLKKLKRRYNPERVILEYNPLWSVKKLEEMEMPRGWGIVQEIVTVDASCFQIYMQNMKSIFMEMSLHADMVMFNRCRPQDPLASFRRSIKVVNPACDIFYVDMEDHPERYRGKTVRFKGRVLKSENANAKFFVPGRMAMTCCADDTTFIGYICEFAKAKSLLMGQWVEVTAVVDWKYMEQYESEGPVLIAKDIKSVQRPEVDLVYFN